MAESPKSKMAKRALYSKIKLSIYKKKLKKSKKNRKKELLEYKIFYINKLSISNKWRSSKWFSDSFTFVSNLSTKNIIFFN